MTRSADPPYSLLQTLQDGDTFRYWFGDLYLHEIAHMIVSVESGISVQSL